MERRTTGFEEYPTDNLRAVACLKDIKNCSMEGAIVPTLLNIRGYKFFFYANEHPPPHVHVMKGGSWAKIELVTGVVVSSTLKAQELNECLELLNINKCDFLEAWNDWFGR